MPPPLYVIEVTVCILSVCMSICANNTGLGAKDSLYKDLFVIGGFW